MPDTTEQQCLDRLHERLQRSRAEVFMLAHELAGDRSSPAAEFPRSRLLRALSGRHARLLLGGAALAFGLLRPKLLWRGLQLGPLLRPVLLRYVMPRLLELMPRLLGQR